MSIASEIARLQQAKADLKTAINSKGGNITTERIDQFASEVAALPSPKEEETKTLTPDFSSGNHVITPLSGAFVIKQVTLIKPADLIPENIKKDVNICGVVGTLESGGASLDRIALICYRFALTKRNSTYNTLKYEITSEMLSKRFFTDGKGNWYQPKDVSVYYNDEYKGKANTNITLFSGTNPPFGKRVEFKVGTTSVGLLLYFYDGEGDALMTGWNNEGHISIAWSRSGDDDVHPLTLSLEFIELPDNFFDDFPYYSEPETDYWWKGNFLEFLDRPSSIRVGWSLIDYD